MAELNYKERQQLEELFGMGGGYVLDFSDRTFGDFVQDSTGKDLYDEAGTYRGGGTSKANRLRTFWRLEPDHLVGKLLHALLDHCRDSTGTKNSALYEDCQRTAQRLQQGAPVADLSALKPNAADKDFEAAAKAARKAIDRNEPEVGLGHLHTFMVWFVRSLCTGRGITFAKDTALHALFGQYRKHVESAGLIESAMTDRILKSCISTLEAFNDVRNNQSLAHANSILNHDEALFIYNHVCSAVRFLQSLERKHTKPAPTPPRPAWLRQDP
jgi:hypothetical protein